jgi:hypothetical protein
MLIARIKRKIEQIRNDRFNDRIYGRRRSPRSIADYKVDADESYWQHVALEIVEASTCDGGESFFEHPVVVDHLASRNAGLGNALLEKIMEHPEGRKILLKCQTPPWGSPYILRKYPFLSPTTASHIANILSIHDELGAIDGKSVVDFGGGYGGLARCLLQATASSMVAIVDIPLMHEVQRKYLESTMVSWGRVRYAKSVDQLNDLSCDVFNASFSMSETPLPLREAIERFILGQSRSVHIIFQDNFNGYDNIIYMRELKDRLLNRGWSVEIKKYKWYGWDSALLLTGIAGQ